MAAKKTKKTSERAVIVGNGPYGLYYGLTDATDAEILKDRSVRLSQCRHIAQWYGDKGGITSLAAKGPCGPRAGESRIGHANPSSLITDVKAVHDVSAEAVVAIAAVKP